MLFYVVVLEEPMLNCLCWRSPICKQLQWLWLLSNWKQTYVAYKWIQLWMSPCMLQVQHTSLATSLGLQPSSWFGIRLVHSLPLPLVGLLYCGRIVLEKAANKRRREVTGNIANSTTNHEDKLGQLTHLLHTWSTHQYEQLCLSDQFISLSHLRVNLNHSSANLINLLIWRTIGYIKWPTDVKNLKQN